MYCDAIVDIVGVKLVIALSMGDKGFFKNQNSNSCYTKKGTVCENDRGISYV